MNGSRKLGLALALALSATGPLWGRMGVVHTRDGQVYAGNIRLENNQLILADLDSASLIPVELEEVRQVNFEEAADSELVPPTAGVPAGLPQPWAALNVGDGSGQTRGQAGLFRLAGGAGSLDSTSDQFHFACKTVQGQTEIVARVVDLSRSARSSAMAGLMIRESLAEDSPFVCVALTAGSGGVLSWREKAGSSAQELTLPALAPPYWLKLKRQGDTIAAYRSSTGKRWRLIDRFELPLASEVRVGLAFAAKAAPRTHERFRPGPERALLDQVREAPSLPLSSFVPRAQLLSGSVVVGPMESSSDNRITFPGAIARPDISLRDIAHLQFQWLGGRQADPVVSGRTGVVLASGEFIDGEFRGLTAHHVRISSVLFGVKNYDSQNEVRAVVFRPAVPVRTPYEVETSEGSRWLARSIQIGENEILIEEPLLGPVRLPIYRLRSIRCAWKLRVES